MLNLGQLTSVLAWFLDAPPPPKIQLIQAHLLLRPANSPFPSTFFYFPLFEHFYFAIDSSSITH